VGEIILVKDTICSSMTNLKPKKMLDIVWLMDLKQLATVTYCSGRNHVWDTQIHHLSTFTTVVHDLLEQEQGALM